MATITTRILEPHGKLKGEVLSYPIGIEQKVEEIIDWRVPSQYVSSCEKVCPSTTFFVFMYDKIGVPLSSGAVQSISTLGPFIVVVGVSG